MTRHTKRKVDHEEHEEEGELDLATLKEHEEATKVKNITRIVLGQWMMETWYFSPFPKEYQRADVLYFCEFDLQFFARREQLQRRLFPVRDRCVEGEGLGVQVGAGGGGLAQPSVNGSRSHCHARGVMYSSP